MTNRRRNRRRRQNLPDYVTMFKDRHGKPRFRFRRKGHSGYYFKSSAPWSDEFMQEYQACLNGEAAPALQPGRSRTKPGTFDALIAAYYLTPEFTGLASSTQATYRGIIERFRAKHGDKRVAAIERMHIKAIIGAMHRTPAAANNLLDRLKALMELAVDLKMRKDKDNPARGVKGFPKETDGFHTWTEPEIALYEKRHKVGSKGRMAMALMLYTGQRRSDAVKMGRQHVTGDMISVAQQKSPVRLEIPLHPELASIIDATPLDNLTFLTTSHGKPFTAAGFGNWFRNRCDEAGLPHCSAHGLRKAAARRLAEAGCSNQQIKAITGHKTDKEVSRYTAAADQRRLAREAMKTTYGDES